MITSSFHSLITCQTSFSVTPTDKSLGTKEALAVRLRKLAIDGEKTLQGSQNLHTSRASRCSAFSV